MNIAENMIDIKEHPDPGHSAQASMADALQVSPMHATGPNLVTTRPREMNACACHKSSLVMLLRQATTFESV